MEAAYRLLSRTGELACRARAAWGQLGECRLCPRQCGADRLAGEPGFCRTGEAARVNGFGPHFGEEAPLVGRGGSGTIFFAGCNLGCVFCQNFATSHGREGQDLGPDELAAIMLLLERQGCHNINLVTPSHVVPQILAALERAAAAGLTLPLVYNTSGYDAPETLRLLEGVVDIYMPDLKCVDAEPARLYLGAPDYPAVARAAIREMHRQVGDLVVDAAGLAVRGLLVRHLVMPHDLAGSAQAMRFLAQEISPATYVNVMRQYRPSGLASRYPPIDRRPTREECDSALDAARRAGLWRIDGRSGPRLRVRPVIPDVP